MIGAKAISQAILLFTPEPVRGRRPKLVQVLAKLGLLDLGPCGHAFFPNHRAVGQRSTANQVDDLLLIEAAFAFSVLFVVPLLAGRVDAGGLGVIKTGAHDISLG